MESTLIDNVVCYNALLSTDAEAPGFSEYGEATGPIHLDNVICDGSEPNLLACSYTPAAPPCSHATDAGVKCFNGKNEARDLEVSVRDCMACSG